MNQINKIREMIDKADLAYYNGSKSIYSDDEYDSLKDQLKKLDSNDPRLKKVGAFPTSILQKVAHKTKMGSQNKCVNQVEFATWYAKYGGASPIMATLKMDGASLALYYIEGRLVQAVTRGDGIVGEDVTANAVKFKGVPFNLNITYTGAVRGECVLSVKNWAKIDAAKTTNPRNLGNGIMRRKDGTESEFLDFVAFDVDCSECNSESDKVKTLEEMGFKVVQHKMFSGKDVVDKAVKYHSEVMGWRNGLEYWIDGVVMKVNDLKVQDAAGVHDDRPRGQIAYKFPAGTAITTLEDIIWSVGHTGSLIPTGIVSQINIGGVTITKVLLNNPEYMAELDVAIGDMVEIERAGDVIPHVASVVDRSNRRFECPECKFIGSVEEQIKHHK